MATIASAAGSELLFDLTSSAYGCHGLIVTCILPAEHFMRGPNRERLNNATLDRPSHRCRLLSCLRPELPTSKCRASKITDRPNHFEPRLSQAVSRLPLNDLPLRQNPLILPDLDQARGVRVFVRLMDDRMSAYKAPVLEVVPLDRQEWAQDSHCADS